MQEYQVTLEGQTLPVPDPFVVLATQNPIEFEGTFPLPEAQLDRFLMKVSVGYPLPDEERLILRRRIDRGKDEVQLECIATREDLLGMRQAVERVHVDPDLEAYITSLVGATREDRRVAVGASPRGSLALLKLARARAGIEGRDYVLPDDVKRFAIPALAHRLILHPEYWMKKRASEEVIDSIVESIPVPAIQEDPLD
jgi:MoxR-like ATPase